MADNPTIRELKMALGDDYRICDIDLERCLYRDFGNGFNVEISGVNTRRAGKKATLYLWYGSKMFDCIIVKRIRDVERTAEAIDSAANSLKEYSDDLITLGFNNRDAIFKMLHPELKKED